MGMCGCNRVVMCHWVFRGISGRATQLPNAGRKGAILLFSAHAGMRSARRSLGSAFIDCGWDRRAGTLPPLEWTGQDACPTRGYLISRMSFSLPFAAASILPM
jgi:hypothetical protein